MTRGLLAGARFGLIASLGITAHAQSLFAVKAATVTTIARGSQDLVKTFERLSCAVFEIETKDSHATGFFTGPHGEFMTAAHVVLDSKYSKDQSGKINITIAAKDQVFVIQPNNTKLFVDISTTSEGAAHAADDLFSGKVDTSSPCYLHIGNSDSVKIGSHLIAIGYPNGSPSASLFEGFLSGRYEHIPIIVPSLGPETIDPGYEVLRVQMPIISGASGSPVIDDNDRVVGIVSEIPLQWTEDLQKGLALFGSDVGGLSIGDFNSTKALIDLIFVVREFESPGFGLAVPISYSRNKH